MRGEPSAGGVAVDGCFLFAILRVLVPRIGVLPVVEILGELSGWNVSHITASSCVSCVPIDFSANPGWGPCGRPDGWSVIDPTSTPRREPNLPET